MKSSNQGKSSSKKEILLTLMKIHGRNDDTMTNYNDKFKICII